MKMYSIFSMGGSIFADPTIVEGNSPIDAMRRAFPQKSIVSERKLRKEGLDERSIDWRVTHYCREVVVRDGRRRIVAGKHANFYEVR